MKIIYVDNIRFPTERAHGYQIAQYCQQMGLLGHEVVLVTPNRSQEKDVARYYGFDKIRFTHTALETGDALRYRWLPRSLGYLLQRWTFLRGVRCWARSQTADIWYTRSPAVIATLMDPRKKKWVLEVHDNPARNVRRWKKIQEEVRFFIPISEGMKSCLLEAGIPESKTLVAHDGVDLEEVERSPKGQFRSRLGISPKKFLLVYTGSLYPWKGVDFVVKAWKRVPPGAALVIVGGPKEDYERLKNLLPREKDPRIHILPSMSRSEVFSLLKEADAALLPTSPDFTIGRTYTSPLKLFEYLAAGLPILASDVPTAREVLTRRVAHFFVQDTKAFITTLETMMNDGGWRQSAALEARALAKKYTWRARAERIAAVLKNVCKDA